MRIVKYCVFCVVLFASAFGEESEGEFFWPLPSSEIITSAFGEYRQTRAHAGVDMSTFGGTGLSVYAVEAGKVVRLRVERRGYGKALYIEHEDGKISVYAHLERFAEKFEKILKEIQRAKKTRYPGDIFLDPPVKVARGERIGASGESGDGPPHFHFELRRNMETPVNPFFHGLKIPRDKIPPKIDAILFYPRDENARINGSPLPRRISFDKTTKTIDIWGEWEIILYARDPCGRNARCGLFKWGAWISPFDEDDADEIQDGEIKGKKLFEAEALKFSYEKHPFGAALYHPYYSATARSSFAHRMAHDATHPPFVKKTRPLVINKENAYLLTVTAEDVAGNSSAQTIVLNGKENRQFFKQPTRESAKTDVTIHRFQRFIAIELPPSEADRPAESVSVTVEKWDKVLFEIFSDGERFITMPIKPNWEYATLKVRQNDIVKISEPLSFIWIDGSRKREILPTKRLRLEFEEKSLYEGGALWLGRLSNEKDAEELKFYEGFEMLPPGVPFRERPPLLANVENAPASRRLGVYRKDFASEKWHHIASSRGRQIFSVLLPFSASYALMEDFVPPKFVPQYPKPGSAVPKNIKEIFLKLTDNGSGVDDESIKFIIDDIEYKGDYDADKNKAFLDLQYEEILLAEGTRYVVVEASDNAGNTVGAGFSFVVLP